MIFVTKKSEKDKEREKQFIETTVGEYKKTGAYSDVLWICDNHNPKIIFEDHDKVLVKKVKGVSKGIVCKAKTRLLERECRSDLHTLSRQYLNENYNVK